VAEQQTQYEFIAVEAKDILADRQAEWARFTKVATRAAIVIAIGLILMAIFLV
jgi:hypothetical protein